MRSSFCAASKPAWISLRYRLSALRLIFSLPKVFLQLTEQSFP